MRLFLVLFMAVALGACGQTSLGNALRTGVVVKGAEIADEGLVNSEWFVCDGASVGSIKRKYGVSADRRDAYNRFCPDTSAVPILTD